MIYLISIFVNNVTVVTQTLDIILRYKITAFGYRCIFITISIFYNLFKQAISS
jgi:hypothetical protein